MNLAWISLAALIPPSPEHGDERQRRRGVAGPRMDRRRLPGGMETSKVIGTFPSISSSTWLASRAVRHGQQQRTLGRIAARAVRALPRQRRRDADHVSSSP